MSDSEYDETHDLWNRVADDWRIQVGEDGDGNRLLNSDPVLWQFAGNVNGLVVLDAGCGTGYLSKKLHDRGARVIGIDFAERMIGIARTHNPDLDFRVDSCAELRTLDDEYFDLLIANYVLMDTPDLHGTLHAFHRVLKPHGVAVLVFSHPCFPQERATVSHNGDQIEYRWNFPYFEQRQCIDDERRRLRRVAVGRDRDTQIASWKRDGERGVASAERAGMRPRRNASHVRGQDPKSVRHCAAAG